MTTAELANKTAAADGAAARNETGGASRQTPLFDEHEGSELRARWQNIQTDFVDDPKASVEQADELVATSIKRLAEMFAKERSNLEATWSRGGEVSTEDLRQALRRYRSFFDRLLSI
jgi:hypothetical protein